MSDITDRITEVLEYALHGCTSVHDPRWPARTAKQVSEALQPELGELEATKLLLEATREQLRRTITDFCAVRDALPREQVARILRVTQA